MEESIQQKKSKALDDILQQDNNISPTKQKSNSKKKTPSKSKQTPKKSVPTVIGKK